MSDLQELAQASRPSFAQSIQWLVAPGSFSKHKVAKPIRTCESDHTGFFGCSNLLQLQRALLSAMPAFDGFFLHGWG